MFGMDVWDAVLLAAGGHLAVITLVRLMHRRRDLIIEDLSREVELEKERLQEERKKQHRREARGKMEQHQREQFEKRMRERDAA
ncbi:MAG: hypothetical protein CMJ64_08525 [Planctomycetaceae bacterium]|nr:hypothetical protein [Planctomycetaceae bacterium]